uniref:Uncharacterized protein n=1 Tax=Fagus sylvatica TaxID=28930 RepID=A0A2N9G6Y2_FAGSY
MLTEILPPDGTVKDSLTIISSEGGIVGGIGFVGGHSTDKMEAKEDIFIRLAKFAVPRLNHRLMRCGAVLCWECVGPYPRKNSEAAKDRGRWSVTVWAIWYARNKFMHENVLMCPQSVLEMGMRLLNDFQRVTAQQSSSGA